MVWLPMFAIFNVRTDVDVCDCTRGLYGHRKSLQWKLTPGENPSSHRGHEPASVLRLVFQSDAVSTELSPFNQVLRGCSSENLIAETDCFVFNFLFDAPVHLLTKKFGANESGSKVLYL